MFHYQGIAIVKARRKEPYAKYYRPIAEVDFKSDVSECITIDNERILASVWLDDPVDIDGAKPIAQKLVNSLSRYRNLQLY